MRVTQNVLRGLLRDVNDMMDEQEDQRFDIRQVGAKYRIVRRLGLGIIWDDDETLPLTGWMNRREAYCWLAGYLNGRENF